MPSCTESFGHAVESGIQGTFSSIGLVVGSKPRWTIVACLVLTVLCGGGFVRWETESRGEELWVPQDTTAQAETMQFEALYPRNSRFNTLLLQGSSSGGNVLTQDLLVEMMRVHDAIATGVATVEGAAFMLTDLCTQSGGSCDSSRAGVCQCLLTRATLPHCHAATYGNDVACWCSRCRGSCPELSLLAVRSFASPTS